MFFDCGFFSGYTFTGKLLLANLIKATVCILLRSGEIACSMPHANFTRITHAILACIHSGVDLDLQLCVLTEFIRFIKGYAKKSLGFLRFSDFEL